MKITIHDSAAECRFQLTGTLAGPMVAELEQSWETARSTTAGRRTALDLAGLESAGAAGKALLERMVSAGVILTQPEVPAACRARPGLAAGLLLPFLLLLAPAHATGEPAGARAALALYLAGASAAPDADSRDATLEVRARLDGHGRTAVLRAVETPSPDGQPGFRVISFAGDDTVRRHVIIRYLGAEAEARGRRDQSLAVTAANYNFRFERAGERGGVPAWVYRVEPRKKRVGLFQGELWIAADSGRVLRQSGRMVRNPSIFVRSVTFVREFDTEGAPRRLYVHLDTRIAGKADLSVRYGPAPDALPTL